MWNNAVVVFLKCLALCLDILVKLPGKRNIQYGKSNCRVTDRISE